MLLESQWPFCPRWKKRKAAGPGEGTTRSQGAEKWGDVGTDDSDRKVMGCWRDYGGETGPGVKAPTPMDGPLPCRGPGSARSSEVCPPAENPGVRP